MFAPFETVKNTVQFVFAKDFRDVKTNEYHQYSKNFVEKMGNFLTKPVFYATDFMLKNIRNPLFIVAVAIISIAITTLFFYPTITISFLSATIPAIFLIKTWMIKLAVFTAIELNILGIGLRTLGRLSNDKLMQAKNSHEVTPVNMGAVQIKVVVDAKRKLIKS